MQGPVPYGSPYGVARTPARVCRAAVLAIGTPAGHCSQLGQAPVAAAVMKATCRACASRLCFLQNHLFTCSTSLPPSQFRTPPSMSYAAAAGALRTMANRRVREAAAAARAAAAVSG